MRLYKVGHDMTGMQLNEIPMYSLHLILYIQSRLGLHAVLFFWRLIGFTFCFHVSAFASPRSRAVLSQSHCEPTLSIPPDTCYPSCDPSSSTPTSPPSSTNKTVRIRTTHLKIPHP